MPADEMRLIIQLVELVWLAAVTLWAFLTARSKANSKSIDDLTGHVNRHENRLDRIDDRLGAMPSHGELGDLYDKINKIAVTQQGLIQTINGTKEIVTIIHNNLMRKST